MNTCPNSINLDLNKLSQHCIIQQFSTSCLAQFAYYIESVKDNTCIIIDPIRDIQQYLNIIKERGSKLKYILMTHFHADFVAGHFDLAVKTGAEIVFGPGAKADFLFKEAKDEEIISLDDQISIKVLHTPGHTMESSCYLLYENENKKQIAVFTGDTLFLGDTGRPDLAVKSNEITSSDLAALLFESVQKLKLLNDDCVVFPGHGAGSACGKNIQSGSYSTISSQKKTNYALNDNLLKKEFIEIATANIPTPPQYFFLDVLMNKKEISFYDDLMKKCFVPVEVNELENLINTNPDDVNIIDSRQIKDIYSSGIIKKSINIPLDTQYAIYSATLLDFKKKTVIVADDGKEHESISRLLRVGYENIIGYLKGGINEWIKNQKPLSFISLADKEESLAIIGKEYVLDVRNPPEFIAPGFIKDSIKIPLNIMESQSDKITKSDHIYILCRTGVRAAIAGTILRKIGFDNKISIMDGGIVNLLEKGVKVEHECSINK